MMSPYAAKNGAKTKENPRSYRMQTMTASKLQSSSKNLLVSNNKSSGKFELPMLSTRSTSKPTLLQQRNQQSASKIAQNAGAQSHNFLPGKIGCGIMN